MTRPCGDYPGTVRKARVPGPDGPVRVHVVLGYDTEGALREVFVHNAPAGTRATVNALCRLLSHALQVGTPIPDLARMLRSQHEGHAPVPWPGGGFVVSLPDALARVLEELAMPTEESHAP